MNPNFCVNFVSPLFSPHCRAGILFKEIAERDLDQDPTPLLTRLPCRRDREHQPCPDRRFPTAQEVAEFRQTEQQRTEALLVADMSRRLKEDR